MTSTMTITTDAAADHELATRGQVVTAAPYCRMGQDYDCACRYCSSWAAAKHAEGIAAWNASTAEHRAWVAQISGAIKCLAAIGQAVAAALAPGLGVGRFVAAIGRPFAEWPVSHYRGCWLRVVGKRGNAKAHVGAVAECKWQGEGGDFAPAPRYRSGWYTAPRAVTVRLGLAVAGQEKLVYVAESQCERVPAPESAWAARVERVIVAEAIKDLRPALVVRLTSRGKPCKGQVAHVVAGRSDVGAHGEVFWYRSTDGRLGLKTEDGRTVWSSARDCAPHAVGWVAPEERADLERVAADLAIEGREVGGERGEAKLAAARGVLAQTRPAK